ncbi:hypothetical protein G7062_09635 [Erysipelothrix sp. HDW6C]|uniref:hypothetical protein n=1 Tax=Erysipelothrix sp. HDW6C TaxID=2714930 RepID=UPI001407FC0E|nr:hypothetical protein [Erysipelothrix sp. HDW6C]QIK70546.1 hypothetical protein G7062_09635 [Erysipelothrix sp. HDW6C]
MDIKVMVTGITQHSMIRDGTEWGSLGYDNPCAVTEQALPSTGESYGAYEAAGPTAAKLEQAAKESEELAKEIEAAELQAAREKAEAEKAAADEKVRLENTAIEIARLNDISLIIGRSVVINPEDALNFTSITKNSGAKASVEGLDALMPFVDNDVSVKVISEDQSKEMVHVYTVFVLGDNDTLLNRSLALESTLVSEETEITLQDGVVNIPYDKDVPLERSIGYRIVINGKTLEFDNGFTITPIESEMGVTHELNFEIKGNKYKIPVKATKVEPSNASMLVGFGVIALTGGGVYLYKKKEAHAKL